MGEINLSFEMDVQQIALLKNRRKDDFDKKKRNDIRAKAKLAVGRTKKQTEKEKRAGGAIIKMPEVFVSNQMKQQRNFVHYKRHKRAHTMTADKDV